MKTHKNVNISMPVWDFSNQSKCEKTMQRTFEEFRRDLANNKFAYDDIELALNSTFLRIFNDLFEVNGLHTFFDKRVVDLERYIFVRGTILHGEHSVNYERFEPKSEYIKSDNRFSPDGVEWLYIALGLTYDVTRLGAIKECRAIVGDHFASVKYRWKAGLTSLKLVDLTIAKEMTFEDINDELELASEEVVRIAVAAGLATGRPYYNSKQMRENFKKWAVYTYAKMVSEQLFVPLDGADKRFQYAPFQCLAKYFERLGYGGIIYDSTVNQESKNIVLFNKHNMEPFDDITEEII